MKVAPGLLLALFLVGCQTASDKSMHTATTASATWQRRLAEDLPRLGHRNWIVVADAAYPDQISPGIQTIATGGTQLEVLRGVLAALDKTPHVKPIVHLDAELAHVPESLAPGVTVFRYDLDQLLQGRRVVTLPHEDVIKALDEAGRTFRVLILKTDLTIPYTSIFLQLDCGYWGPEPEKKLRALMNGQR